MYPYYVYFSDLWLITCWAAVLYCYVGLSAGWQKLEFENNAVSCMTFQWRLTCQPGSYCVYVSLSGFLKIHPDLVLMTLLSCTGSLFACMSILPFSWLSPAFLWYCSMFASFWTLLVAFCSSYWWCVLPVAVTYSVAYNAGLLLILFSISASGSVVFLDSFLDWCCRYVSAVTVVGFMCRLFLEMHLPLFCELNNIWSIMVNVVALANYCPMGPWTTILMLDCYSWPYGNFWKYWWGIIVIFSLSLY